MDVIPDSPYIVMLEAVLAGTSADTGRLSSDFSIEDRVVVMEAQLVLTTHWTSATFALMLGQTIDLDLL